MHLKVNTLENVYRENDHMTKNSRGTGGLAQGPTPGQSEKAGKGNLRTCLKRCRGAATDHHQEPAKKIRNKNISFSRMQLCLREFQNRPKCY